MHGGTNPGQRSGGAAMKRNLQKQPDSGRIQAVAVYAPQFDPSAKFYWVTKRWGGTSKETAARYGVPVYENPFEHEGLCDKGASSPQILMKRLRELGWKPSHFTDSSEKFARIEITRTGFNVVYFPSYAAAVAAWKTPGGKVLAECPFCQLSDRIEIISWSNERADGSEFIGDAVRCNRCDAVVPLHLWQRRIVAGPRGVRPCDANA